MRLRTGWITWFGLALFGLSAVAVPARADGFIRELLSDPSPTAFAPGPMTTEDFGIEVASGILPEGLNPSLQPGTLEWVRVSEVLVLPRARLLWSSSPVPIGVEGSFEQDGFDQPFRLGHSVAQGSVRVGLVPGPAGEIRVRFLAGSPVGEERALTEATLRLVYRPKNPNHAGRVFVDCTCSDRKISVLKARPLRTDSALAGVWTYIGCRLLHVKGPEGKTAELEMWTFRANSTGRLSRDGFELKPADGAVWVLRLSPEVRSFTLSDEVSTERYNYVLAPRLNDASIGIGLGPYASGFSAPGVSFSSWAPVLTVYGSYFLTETSRLVGFDLTPLRGPLTTDFGLYFQSESVRMLDRRMSLSVMFGAHALAFPSEGRHVLKYGVPQGFELVYRDAGLRRWNATLGAFIYPPISGKSYFNVWVRYGIAAFFVEFNHISWQETVNDSAVFSRNSGLAIGFPLARFL
jgi:hypothetical protein